MHNPSFRLTVSLMVIAILLGGWLRPTVKTRTGLAPAAFYAHKIGLEPGYHLAVIGDSRVVWGVSPAAMEKELAGRRVVNFGFSGACFFGDYLTATERLLPPENTPRVIAFGVTPVALTNLFQANNEFLKWSRMRAVDLAFERAFGELFDLTAPWDAYDAWVWARAAVKGTRETYSLAFHRDGWVAADAEPFRIEGTLTKYRRIFLAHKASADIENHLLERTRRWREKGIDVVAFRQPVDARLETIETNLSGFDEAAFSARFREAGGAWIPLSNEGLAWPDGHHLASASAVRFSGILARAIAAAVPGLVRQKP